MFNYHYTRRIRHASFQVLPGDRKVKLGGDHDNRYYKKVVEDSQPVVKPSRIANPSKPCENYRVMKERNLESSDDDQAIHYEQNILECPWKRSVEYAAHTAKDLVRHKMLPPLPALVVRTRMR